MFSDKRVGRSIVISQGFQFCLFQNPSEPGHLWIVNVIVGLGQTHFFKGELLLRDMSLNHNGTTDAINR